MAAATTGPGTAVRRTPAGTSARVRGLRGVLLELALVGVAVGVNLLVRVYTLDRTNAAIAHAHEVIALEKTIGVGWEPAVQRATLAVPGVGIALTHIYVWGYLPVLLGCLVWLYLRDWPAYRTLRNSLLVAGAVGMPVYAFYPCAPPWIGGTGYTDTVAHAGWLTSFARPEGVANHIGAMPSFHIAFLVLAAWAVGRSARSPTVRVLCVVEPVLVGWAIIATGNHWVLDIPAGLALAGAGLLGAAVIDRLRPVRDTEVTGAGRSGPRGPDGGRPASW